MFCKACGCEMEEYDRFCPSCGAKYTPAETVEYISPAPTKEYRADPDGAYAPVDSGAAAHAAAEDDEFRTVVLDGYAEPFYPEDDVSFPGAYQPSAYAQMQPPKAPQPYQDSFTQQNEPRFGNSGWQDPSQSMVKRYRRTTAGKRFASLLLCLLMLLFGFCAMTIGVSRLALSESNIRKAYQTGTLADLKITTDKGEQSLGQIFIENVVDANTNLPVELDGKQVDAFLRTPNVNTFTENLFVDLTQFFIFGKTPTLLNSGEITAFLRSISGDFQEQVGYALSDEDITYLGKRIDGGDLSFLSIDGNGGYFKQKYGFSPTTVPSMFSVWGLVICAGLAALCMIMIFVINSRNLPAGLSFNGGTMIFFGILNTLLAAGMLVLSYVRRVFLLSELLRSAALAMGAISLIVLVIGIVFSVIKTLLRNRI